ncbi:6-phosphogluconolactonase [Hymenobacter fodinae]|uniref:6-phosphogluconolactonase n=1 Tax=Hymenobacter fodinae TaxID=2510796 RepID=A0A4Z0P1B2_9BACT|nr:6-phosphogluconolactonase [Hymenobacter fodinae]TGE04945.1 6-phosphogluconolactonase [Hymenobacter fodinae]
MEKNNLPELHIASSSEEVLRQLADFFRDSALKAVAAQVQFSVALSGGNSPRKLFELLASAEYRDQIPWEKGAFFFGDERNVPHDDPESNYGMAKAALLDPLGIKAEQVFAVNTALPPEQAAQQYTQDIEQFFAPYAVRFDLILLGLGDNSHTASLFPHTPVLHTTEANVQAVFVEEKQAYRITFTAPLINQARAVAFLVYGGDKALAVKRVLTADRQIEEYPAQLIAPTSGNVQWFIDQAAAAELGQLGAINPG